MRNAAAIPSQDGERVPVPGDRPGQRGLLKELGVKKIVTACPHCYNTLKNDYPQLGANFEVYHHTEFINMLAEEGKIEINPVLEGVTTYHDPCYLGRVNRVFDPPRDDLAAR